MVVPSSQKSDIKTTVLMVVKCFQKMIQMTIDYIYRKTTILMAVNVLRVCCFNGDSW